MVSTPHGIVLDSAPVIDFLLDGPGADTIAGLLRAEPTRMATINLAEVVDVLVRVYGVDPDVAALQVGELVADVVEPIAPSPADALRAGALRARVFHRQTARISLADCFAVAITRAGDRLLTSDAALARMARAEGIEVVEPLGRRSRRRRSPP